MRLVRKICEANPQLCSQSTVTSILLRKWYLIHLARTMEKFALGKWRFVEKSIFAQAVGFILSKVSFDSGHFRLRLSTTPWISSRHTLILFFALTSGVNRLCFGIIWPGEGWSSVC